MTGAIAILEDTTLIEMALAGQSEYFVALMNRHASAVRGCVRSIARNTSDDEDDLVQEVVLKVWRFLPTFRAESSFRTWISRVAFNEAMQSRRRQRRSRIVPTSTDLSTFASEHESPHRAFVRLEARNTVRQAVAKLPLKYRQVLILRDINELSEKDTARSLRASLPLVKTRLFRARQMLSAALQKRTPGRIAA
jgi:RNA polymerase sigma-70 factor (ECF subfamily)